MSRGQLCVSMCRAASEYNNNMPLSNSAETRKYFDNEAVEVALSNIVDHRHLDSQGFTIADNNIPPKSAVTILFDNNEVSEVQHTSIVDHPHLTSHDFSVVQNIEFEVIEQGAGQEYVISLPEIRSEEHIPEKVIPNIRTRDLNLEEISDDSDTDMNQALVPYSETSDSDSSDSNYPKKCKRRKRGLQVNKENWFAVKNKRLRKKGQSYLGRIKTSKT